MTVHISYCTLMNHCMSMFYYVIYYVAEGGIIPSCIKIASWKRWHCCSCGLEHKCPQHVLLPFYYERASVSNPIGVKFKNKTKKKVIIILIIIIKHENHWPSSRKISPRYIFCRAHDGFALAWCQKKFLCLRHTFPYKKKSYGKRKIGYICYPNFISMLQIEFQVQFSELRTFNFHNLYICITSDK